MIPHNVTLFGPSNDSLTIVNSNGRVLNWHIDRCSVQLPQHCRPQHQRRPGTHHHEHRCPRRLHSAATSSTLMLSNSNISDCSASSDNGSAFGGAIDAINDFNAVQSHYRQHRVRRGKRSARTWRRNLFRRAHRFRQHRERQSGRSHAIRWNRPRWRASIYLRRHRGSLPAPRSIPTPRTKVAASHNFCTPGRRPSRLSKTAPYPVTQR